MSRVVSPVCAAVPPEDDLIGFVPFSASLLAGATSSWENTATLARAAFTPGSEFAMDGEYAPFWATQPALRDMLCLEAITPDLAAMLQART